MTVTSNAIRALGYRLLHPHGDKWIPGLPPGLSPELVSRICERELWEQPTGARHTHLSGWKEAGAYRLVLDLPSHRRWKVIYKNAVYHPEHIPALAGLPVKPGPPEYSIYQQAGGPLSAYLPAVYECHEVRPGEHYQYFLEDLASAGYHRVRPEECVQAAEALPGLQEALAEWWSSAHRNGLLHYGRESSQAFSEYARENLHRYLEQTRCPVVSEVCRQWDDIAGLHLRAEWHDLQVQRPIHGDYNASNIHAHSGPEFSVKLVDWEWAGLGTVHADLAALLKQASPEEEAQALRTIAEHQPELATADHRRLYTWCQLERGLLDGAFIAVQHLETEHTAELHYDTFVRDSATRVLQAWKTLR